MSESVRNTRLKRNNTEDVSHFLYSKIPPQARELEEAVLGALLLEKNAIEEIADILNPENFYVDAHSTIYRAIKDLFSNSQPIDLLTVIEELRKQSKLEECGGAYYLSELTNKIGSSAHIEKHARIIIQKFLLREIIRIGNDGIKDAYEDTTDVFELIDRLQLSINSLNENSADKGFTHVGDDSMKIMSELETIKHSDKSFIGVPSGIKKIDKFFHGFRITDLIVLAARPSMGKSALALSILHGASELGIPVAFASLEMDKNSVIKRLVSIDTNIPLEDIMNATYSDEDSEKIVQSLKKYQQRKSNIYIDDKAGVSIPQLRAKIGKLVKKKGVKMLVVDYLQLMTSGQKGLNREQEISTISRELKNIAKDLDIPVITLSQLNRSVESRGGEKKPQLSDLRESGAIEQDADVVMFLYRPEYYGLTESNDGSSTRNMAELIIAKRRNGATGVIDDLCFIKKCAKFCDEPLYRAGEFLNEFEQMPKQEKFDVF